MHAAGVIVRYALRRLGTALLVLLGLSLLAFFLVRLVPGDTATAMLGLRYTEAAAEEVREQYGLDEPLPVQYATWLARVSRGDFGVSTSGRRVAALIAEALPVTLQLAGLAMAFALAVGLPLGVLAAGRGRVRSRAAGFAGLAGISVPNFWLGTMLVLVFALRLRWLPAGGFVPITRDAAGNLRHMALPAAALGVAVAAVVLRMTRASMRRVLSSDYVRTARAKGLAPRRVLGKHALRNAMLPVLTILGVQAGYLLGGSVVIEEVFSLPGVGRLALESVERRDYPLLQGVVLLIGAGFVASNLVVDLLYGVVDPRVREAR